MHTTGLVEYMQPQPEVVQAPLRPTSNGRATRHSSTSDAVHFARFTSLLRLKKATAPIAARPVANIARLDGSGAATADVVVQPAAWLSLWRQPVGLASAQTETTPGAATNSTTANAAANIVFFKIVPPGKD
jgi:hypothetical protein